MNREGKVYSLLATARIANVPSVISNLGVGVLLAYSWTPDEFQWPWMLSIAAVLFYISGNFLNDWEDCEWDKEHRPERALPRGIFSSRTYLMIATIGMIAGLVMVGSYGFPAFVIALILVRLIVLYTRVHKSAAWSVIPMGLCRALLPVLGFAACIKGFSHEVAFPAIALLAYIIALSLSARWEARGDLPDSEKIKARGLLFGCGIFAAALPMIAQPSIGWIGVPPLFLWLVFSLQKYQKPVSAHVSALLAGIPLVDWVTLLPMALIWKLAGRIEVNDPMFLTALILAPVCFVFGRLLQRLAPAT